jgi:hypothetical protein
MKVLGDGELSVALFVVADAFTKSAQAKIEAAGGSVNVLEIPGRKRPALGLGVPGGDVPADAGSGPPAEASRESADDAPASEAPTRARRPKGARASTGADAGAAPHLAPAPAVTAAADAAGDPDAASAEAVAPEPGAADVVATDVAADDLPVADEADEAVVRDAPVTADDAVAAAGEADTGGEVPAPADEA